MTEESASSWACSGEECSVTFDLQVVEELVQISMGGSGAERARILRVW